MKKYKDYIILILFAMGSQGIIYYLVKSLESNYITLNSFLNVPLIKPFIYFYNTWYPFILLCTFLTYKYNKENFKLLISTMLIAALFAHITYIIYPTVLSRPNIIGNTFTDKLIRFTYQADTPAINCFPSMHCIYCFIIGFYIILCNNIRPFYKVISCIYLIAIILSTMFVKQHIIEDVIAALIYTAIALLITHFSKEKIKSVFNKLGIS